MKSALALFLALTALASAHTRWPGAYQSGLNQGRADGWTYATDSRNAVTARPAPAAVEVAALAKEIVTAVECPAPMRARWLLGYRRGFREGCGRAARAWSLFSR